MENNYTYELFNDGYDIYKDGNLVATQREPYAHVYKNNGTYEENATLQIESLIAGDESTSDVEVMRADIDYLAIMTDVELPSQGGTEDGTF